jgi:signal peptidase I
MGQAIREFVEAVLLALVVFFVLQTSVQNFKVEGSSMEPTLEEGQYFLVNKLVYLRVDLKRLSRLVPFWEVKERRLVFPFHPPRRGEVVVFRYPRDPRRDFVKRVVGLPGERVEIRNGVVYINGSPLEEPYVTIRSPGSTNPVRLGPEQYYVLGDNRRSSNDSRDWGPVPLDYIIGKVWVSYWPPSRLGFLSGVTLNPGTEGQR